MTSFYEKKYMWSWIPWVYHEILTLTLVLLPESDISLLSYSYELCPTKIRPGVTKIRPSVTK